MSVHKYDRERVDRFKTAFNKIHVFMQKTLQSNNENFSTCLEKMNEKHLIKRQDYNFLHDCRELRNFIVHNQDLYMAVPAMNVVEHIERLANRYEKEPTVFSEFQKRVQIINASDTMYRVMKIIEDTGFTQFPVYDEGQFINLLTENVLTLWLARHVVRIQEMGFADLRETARDALKLHNDDRHWEFIPRNMTITAATALFAERPVLEALIITEQGKPTETPIGIVTRSDALDMLDGKRDTQVQDTVNSDD